MQAAVTIGILLALAGLTGIGWCIWQAASIKGSDQNPDEARKAMARLNAVNMASVSLAFLGLAAVAVGIILS